MRRIGWGIVILVIGLWVWAGYLGLPEIYRFNRNWPLLIVFWGAYVIYRAVRRWARRRVCQRRDVIAELEKGKIDVDRAVEELRKGSF